MKKISAFSVLALLVIAGAAVYLASNFDYTQLAAIKWHSIAAGFGFVIAQTLFYALTSKVILSGMGYTRKFADILAANLISQIAKVTITSKLDMPAKIYLNKKILDLTYPAAMLVVALRVFLMVFATAVIAGVLLLSVPEGRSLMPPAFPAAIIVLSIIGYLILSKTDLEKVSVRGPRLVRRLLSFAVRTNRALREIPPGKLMAAFAILVANIVISVTFLLVLYYQLGYRPGVEVVFLSFTVSSLAGFFSMIPLGLGVVEASFVLLMDGFGYRPEVSSVVILVKRVVWTFSPLILSLPFAIAKGPRFLSAGRRRSAGLEADAGVREVD